MQEYLGEIAGIVTAMCWTATALFFQVASRRIGSLVVNLLRLILAGVFYTIYLRIAHGVWWPQADAHAWTYLGISALIGYVLGDFFLFKSYEYISSKTSTLIFTIAPPIAAVLSWIMLDERLTMMNVLGMLVVLLGVFIVILFREDEDQERKTNRRLGIAYAVLGTIGQGVGSVFSKLGMGDMDPFMASQMRVLVGIVGFLLVITAMRRWGRVRDSFKDAKGLVNTSLGAFFGPFLGVGISLFSIQLIPVGIAATLMSTIPIFILAPSAIFLKEKLNFREILGAFVAVGGILIFFLA